MLKYIFKLHIYVCTICFIFVLFQLLFFNCVLCFNFWWHLIKINFYYKTVTPEQIIKY